MNMNPSARYVTQSHIWDCHIGKPLTNRTIAKYQRLGRYGANKEQTKQPRKKRANSLDKLMALLDL